MERERFPDLLRRLGINLSRRQRRYLVAYSDHRVAALSAPSFCMITSWKMARRGPAASSMQTMNCCSNRTNRP